MALFAMTLIVGMQADYAGLIDKQQLASLKMTREADQYAKKLLLVLPDTADAYLGLAWQTTSSGVCQNSRNFSRLRWDPRRQKK